MLQKLLLRWAVLTLAVWLATLIVPDVTVHGGFWTFVWVALLFGLVNAVIGPVLRLLALPFTLLTLGLFAIIVNGVLVVITDALSEKFDVDGFFPAVLAALVISLVSMVLNRFTSGKRRS